MHWRLSLSDLGEILLLPPLAGLLRTHAPASRLTNVSVAVHEVAHALEAREIDLAIGILQPRHKGVRAELLFREHYVAVSMPDWTPLGTVAAYAKQTAQPMKLSERQLAAADTIVASPTATFHGSVERMLERMKLADRIILRPRHFGAMPDLVRSTGLLAIVPEMFANMLHARDGFRIWVLPRSPGYDVNLLWHRSTKDDPALHWLREHARALFLRPLE